MDEDKSLAIFKAIVKFVTSLNECFGASQKTLQLYCRLLRKTTIVHEDAIKKHIGIFKNFCAQNRDNIINRDINFKQSQIKYSERVYINLTPICKKATKDNLNVIWKHLLIISAYLDPESGAKDILKKNKEEKQQVQTESSAVKHLRKDNESSSKEDKFLDDIINTVELNVDKDSDNPMEAVNSMMNSGVFNNLMGSMNDGLQGGDLDMGKLLGSVQGMVTSLNDEMKDTVGDNPAGDMTEMLNHMNGMMGMMSKMSGQMKNAGLDVTEMPEGLEEDMKKLNNMKFD